METQRVLAHLLTLDGKVLGDEGCIVVHPGYGHDQWVAVWDAIIQDVYKGQQVRKAVGLPDVAASYQR